MLEANMDSEERVENKRIMKRLQQEKKEKEMAEALKMVRFMFHGACLFHLQIQRVLANIVTMEE